MAKILINVSDDVNSFTAGDVLVYCEDKTFKTVNVYDLIEKRLKNYETERTELLNELKAEKKRYKSAIEKFGNLVDGLENALKWSKN